MMSISSNILRGFSLSAYAATIAAMLLTATSCSRGPISDLRRKKYDRAIASFEIAVKEKPGNGNYLTWLGVSQWKAGKNDMAMESFRKAAGLMPTNPVPLEFQACVLMDLEQWDNAERILRAALDMSPGNPRILTRLSALKFSTGNMTTAKAYLDKARASDPAYSPALFNLAWLNYSWLGRKDDARNLFEQFLAVSDSREYESVAKQAMSDMSRAGKPQRHEAAIQVNRGIACYKSQEWPEAIKCFEQAVSLDPSWDTAYHNLGMAHIAAGASRSAVEAFKNALKQNPSRTDSRYALACARRNTGDNVGAISDLHELVKMAPTYADSHYLLGVLYSADRKSYAKAREHYNRYLELAPKGAYSAAAKQWLSRNKS